jgi:flagellar P-ring protein FlgI
MSFLLKKIKSCLLIALMLASGTAYADRLKDIASIAGQRPNQLIGYGLVVGLDGTGDTTRQVPFTGESISTMLAYLGTSIPPSREWQLRNVAAVMVTAELPALSRQGQSIDVTVSSLGNARSLRGGTLLMTPLRAANGMVYAQAQGSVVVPGAVAITPTSRLQVNQQAAGRIPSGALVEQSAPIPELADVLELQLKRADFAQTQRVVERLSEALGADSVLPIDARTVTIRVPTDPFERSRLMARIMELEIGYVSEPAKVVINARTGSVVMNQAVRVGAVAVSHGNLTVRVQTTNRVVQPPAGSLFGQPLIERNEELTIETDGTGSIVQVNEGATLDSVVRAFNLLGATPQDLMAILQAMKASGALRAELEII